MKMRLLIKHNNQTHGIKKKKKKKRNRSKGNLGVRKNVLIKKQKSLNRAGVTWGVVPFHFLNAFFLEKVVHRS